MYDGPMDANGRPMLDEEILRTLKQILTELEKLNAKTPSQWETK